MTGLGETVLQAQALTKVWVDGPRQIDIGIDQLTLRAGDFRVITGPSGSGKSTVMDLLALALRPDTGGQMLLDWGRGLADIRELMQSADETMLAKLRAATFGYVVQTSELIPFLTVAENCRVQQAISRRGSCEDTTRVAATLDLTDLMNAYPSDLSVGQRQRAAITRALCCEPRIVLADEPTANQDPSLKDTVIEVLGEAACEGAAVVIVTHDVELVQRHKLDRISNRSSHFHNHWHSRFYDETRVN